MKGLEAWKPTEKVGAMGGDSIEAVKGLVEWMVGTAPCVLCGLHPTVLGGIYIPDDATMFGAPPGEGAQIPYVLCDCCGRLPHVLDKVEFAMLRAAKEGRIKLVGGEDDDDVNNN